MRARNVKPGFFRNEDLAECSAFARLCFIGLWMLADREGRLLERIKRIKGELFPYENVEVAPLLDELEQHGFILRYETDGARAIQILKFHQHQAPHYSERQSFIKPPEFREFSGSDGFIIDTKLPEGSGSGPPIMTTQLPENSGSPPGVLSESPPLDEGLTPETQGPRNPLNPESRILNPDSPFPPSVVRFAPKKHRNGSAEKSTRCPDEFAVTPQLREWASQHCPSVDVELETAKFRDHEFAKARSDWPAAWRNWLRNVPDERTSARAPTLADEMRRQDAQLRQLQREHRGPAR